MLAQWSHPSPAQIEEAEVLAQSLGVFPPSAPACRGRSSGSGGAPDYVRHV